ncbi:ATP-binding cassette domain-containing protein [Leifsonia poae]|uniref:ATP-binding cassette domain-containing protein n=1 Tax=Leifsonia poae TaxID=110933 RepID=UPI0027E1A7EF|nr:ATP-binding cassette domain-containing protein [Leifsonia poae]
MSRGAGPVISDVSLRVEPGRITALVGPNGAGKMSRLESVSGIVAPSSGTISLRRAGWWAHRRCARLRRRRWWHR